MNHRIPRRLRLGALCLAFALIVAACSATSAEEASPTPAQAVATQEPEVNLALIPDDYKVPAAERGTVEYLEYTSHHTADGGEQSKRATVYLPPGYDAAQGPYLVMYLMHGGGGDEHSWLGEPAAPTTLVDTFDHMIGDGLIPPLIVVAPTFDTTYRNGGVDDNGEQFFANLDAFSDELVGDLIPAAEGRYSTYATSFDEAGLEASRDHRVFAGFSMGGVTTWYMLEHRLDDFRYFMPMSMDSWNQGVMGGLNSPDATAEQLASAIASSGWTKDDYEIFAATGTDDFAMPNMDTMLPALDAYPDQFVRTTTGFGDGNLMYWKVKWYQHDYVWGFDYVYQGLQLLFGENP